MTQTKKPRLLYIDALRGVTMFLVVYHHVLAKCFREQSLFELAVQSFRMPIFFFVSGFVAYKALDFWTLENTSKRLVKKVQSQVIPTLIFFSAYFYFMLDLKPMLLLYQYGWRQYWFTIVLFEFFVVYFAINFFTRKHPKVNAALLIVMALAMSWSHHMPHHMGKLCLLTIDHKFSLYFIYFVLGTFVRKYYDTVMRVLDKWGVLAILAVLFAVQVPTLVDGYHLPADINRFFVTWSIRFTGLFMVFGLFLKLRDSFTETGRVTRCLTFVGRRTLDIYLMHFFFITKLSVMHLHWSKHVPLAVDHILVVLYACAVVAACLIVSAVIRKSRFLGKLLFAAK